LKRIGALEGRTGRRRAEMKRRGLRIALGKVRRRELYCLLSVRLSFVFIIILLVNFFFVI